MSSSEIRLYIQQLAEQNENKLSITSKVMYEFGVKYHYSFKEWVGIVSKELQTFKSSDLATSLFQQAGEDHAEVTSSVPDCVCETKEVQLTVDEEQEINEEATSNFYVDENHDTSLQKTEIFKITFGDTYEVADAILKNVFRRLIFHIGVMRVKELGIKVDSLPLIIYVPYNRIKYEKCLPDSSYYIYKMTDEQMEDAIFEIIIRLQLEARFKKGNNVIFQWSQKKKDDGTTRKPTFDNCTKSEDGKNISTTILISEKKDSLSSCSRVKSKPVIKTTNSTHFNNSFNLGSSKFKHPDILDLTSIGESVDLRLKHRVQNKVSDTIEIQMNSADHAEKPFPDIKDITYYKNEVKRIPIKYKRGGADPRIPIFLLTIIELIDNASVKINKFNLNAAMRATYLALWDKHIHSANLNPNIEIPYVSLASSNIWELRLWKEGEMPKKTVIEICIKVRRAELDSDLFHLLKIPENRLIMKNFIIDYFNLKP